MADSQGVMTPAELVSAERMLRVLDEQIALVKQRVDRCKKDWSLGTTDRQAFFYSTDSTGLMRFHSDSAFVAEQIFIYSCPDGGRAFLSIEDMSSGRALTIAQDPRYDDITDTTTKVQGIWIPPSAWAPTVPYGDDPVQALWSGPTNFDHVATLETDFVVARGGVLRFRFRHSIDGMFYPTATPVAVLNYTVTLIGYKVY